MSGQEYQIHDAGGRPHTRQWRTAGFAQCFGGLGYQGSEISRQTYIQVSGPVRLNIVPGWLGQTIRVAI